ncbi:ankyrin repeat-containing domain, PGG domain protein [Artemisia annua]|uniref:Ankyrin repeat-containing domain, PGG domain protein n=1 Tax=Artemisia annua TaxID=35608 RepID=A0A2U1PHY9_ARTAN|nr:ankyrin repeat-containing domain, PGG domain protein [Artemisia annua]
MGTMWGSCGHECESHRADDAILKAKHMKRRRFVVAAENESEALQLLRVIWGDIVAQPKNLRKLIFELLDKLEKETRETIQGPDQVSQLKNLVYEHVVKMHVETQALFKQDNKTGPEKGDQAMELQKHISEYVKIYDETLNLISHEAGKEDQAQKVQKLISERIAKMRATTKKETYSHRVLFVAAEMGNTNFLVELIRRSPGLIWKDSTRVTVEKEGCSLKKPRSVFKKTAKQKRLEDVSGVALQMQRELLWFQEVSKMIPPSYKERKNDDDLIPHELFTKEHKELVTQGEIWMKGTANQCMVVAALIATIVFAAAFTVPGGYNQDNEGLFMDSNPYWRICSLASHPISVFAIWSVFRYNSVYIWFKIPL